MNHRKKIAVVGGGVAGIGAAHLLSRSHDVTVFEKNDYLGGHTNTVILDKGEDAGLAVDTGFIVCNDQTYPNFHRFMQALGVEIRFSDMSFGFYSDQNQFHYAGRTLSSLFSKRGNLVSGRFYRFLWDIGVFARRAKNYLLGSQNSESSLSEFLVGNQIAPDVIRYFILPMGAAIWSCSTQAMRDYPAVPFLKFFENHGLLSFRNRPRWQTVVGGSATYVRAFQKNFSGSILLNQGVEKIERTGQGVFVSVAHEAARKFDAVIIATHADQALRLLEKPTEQEVSVLGCWTYEKNVTYLHTDERFLPPERRAWASWNFREEKEEVGGSGLSVTYSMNFLQGFNTKKHYLVTLNPKKEIAAEQIIREIHYTHPHYNFASVRSQSALLALNGKNATWFCGSYFGNGFHEDALTSGLKVAKDFGEIL